MSESASKFFSAFNGSHLIAAGPPTEVALAVKAAIAGGAEGPVLTFDDASGAVIDLDLRGSDAEVARRLEAMTGREPDAPRGRGRPRLGVVAREITLLPRHWDWLAVQPGGASVALRRLVDAARRADGGASEARQDVAAAYRFLHAIAGDFDGFEEAARALFASDRAGFAARIAAWPADVQNYAKRLAWPARAGAGEPVV
jgi:uncharacterized protein